MPAETPGTLVMILDLRFQSSSSSMSLRDGPVDVLDLLVDKAQQLLGPVPWQAWAAESLRRFFSAMRIWTRALRREIRSSSSTCFSGGFFQRAVLWRPGQSAARTWASTRSVFSSRPIERANSRARCGIDQGDGHAGLEQFRGDAAVQASGGFDDHQLNAEPRGARRGVWRCPCRRWPAKDAGRWDRSSSRAWPWTRRCRRRWKETDRGDEPAGEMNRAAWWLPCLADANCVALRRVQPAVRVKYTRPPTIRLRDGVLNALARSICRRPPLRGLLATLRSPRSGMLDWTRFHGGFEHTRHGGHGGRSTASTHFDGPFRIDAKNIATTRLSSSKSDEDRIDTDKTNQR